MIEIHQPARCFDVYHWPEFKALCRRLGIPWGSRTMLLRISIDLRDQEGVREPVRIEHEFDGADRSTPPILVLDDDGNSLSKEPRP